MNRRSPSVALAAAIARGQVVGVRRGVPLGERGLEPKHVVVSSVRWGSGWRTVGTARSPLPRGCRPRNRYAAGMPGRLERQFTNCTRGSDNTRVVAPPGDPTPSAATDQRQGVAPRDARPSAQEHLLVDPARHLPRDHASSRRGARARRPPRAPRPHPAAMRIGIRNGAIGGSTDSTRLTACRGRSRRCRRGCTRPTSTVRIGAAAAWASSCRLTSDPARANSVEYRA